jgi:hypothetical protein
MMVVVVVLVVVVAAAAAAWLWWNPSSMPWPKRLLELPRFVARNKSMQQPSNFASAHSADFLTVDTVVPCTDMLEVGNMATYEESRAHFGAWFDPRNRNRPNFFFL